TFLLWRRMKLWELRSYEQVIKLEQERLVYQARLRSRFGRSWRRKAPVESLMPLRLARYGVPLAETAPSGLAAAGIEPALLPPAPRPQTELERVETPAAAVPPQVGPGSPRDDRHRQEQDDARHPAERQEPQEQQWQEQPEYVEEEPESSPWFAPPHQEVVYEGGYDPSYVPDDQMWAQYEAQQAQYEAEQRQAYQGRGQRVLQEQQAPQEQNVQEQGLREYEEREPSPEDTGTFPIPSGPNRTRQLGEGGGTPVQEPDEESFYQVFKQSINGSYPTPREFGDNVEAEFRVTLPEPEAKRLVTRFTNRHTVELEEDHIA
ncbi:hypothetical protein ACFYXC_40430, partial [Streptomyces sp. NPDC002701]|uniref:hypothetical protein n=1 Tax=Streptomyces sp. NPDC002701 TaxID=3364661 RepID=UPI003686F336